MSGKCGGGKARRCSNEVGKAGQLLNGIGRLAYLLIPTHSVPELSLELVTAWTSRNTNWAARCMSNWASEEVL